MKGIAAIALLVGLLGATPAARAAGKAAHLVYVREAGAAQCPDEEAVRKAVAARLGYDPFALSAPRTVTVSLRSRGPGLLARIELSDETGELKGRQEIASASRRCDDLAPAMELAVSLAVDPLGTAAPLGTASGAAPPAEEPRAPSGPPPDAELPTPPVIPVEPPPPRRPPAPAVPVERTHLRAGFGGIFVAGTAPNVTGGLTARFGLRESGWSLDFEARGDFPSRGEVSGGQVTSSLVGLALVPCLRLGVARGVDITACGVFLGGARIGRGDGYPQNLAPVDPILLAGGRAGLEVPIRGRLSLGIHADLLAVVLGEPLHASPDVAYAMPPVAGDFGVSLLFALR